MSRRHRPAAPETLTRQQVIELLRACDAHAEADCWEQTTLSAEYLLALAKALALPRRSIDIDFRSFASP